MSPELDRVLLAICIFSLTFAPQAERSFQKSGKVVFSFLFAMIYYFSLFHVVEVILR